jgi:hypothetical protein
MKRKRRPPEGMAMRIAPPPCPREGANPEDERFQRRLEEAERQGTLSRLIPRPQQPMDFGAWQAEVRRRVLRERPWVGSGRKRGPPFRDRDECLGWLREKAATLRKNEQPITLPRVGGLAIGTKGLKTEDPANAAKTIGRWCKHFLIDFKTEVKNF